MKTSRANFARCLLAAVLVIGPASALALEVNQELVLPSPFRTIGYAQNNGSGFVVTSLTDSDGDGIIPLPQIPTGIQAAIGFPDAAGEDCLIYTTIGTTVGGVFNVPFFERFGGGFVGAVLSELSQPTSFTAGQSVTIAGGVYPGWEDIRIIDRSGTRDLPFFLANSATLPSYTGSLIVSTSYLRITVVPEPADLIPLGSAFVWLTARRRKLLSAGCARE